MTIKRNYERYENMTFEDMCSIFYEKMHFSDVYKQFICEKVEYKDECQKQKMIDRGDPRQEFLTFDTRFINVYFHTNNKQNEKFLFKLNIDSDKLSCKIENQDWINYASLTLKSFEYLLKEEFITIGRDSIV